MIETLTQHAQRLAKTPLVELSSERAGKRVLEAAGWRADFARHYIDKEAKAALLEFGEAEGLQASAFALFNGDIVNPSENRPALHWALRAGTTLSGEAEAVRKSVLPALQFARDVNSGAQTSADGTPFQAVLHIGIGGSDFGPRLIADAFPDKASGKIDLRFCANVDPLDLERAMAGLSPKSTLVIGVSKSFGTEETLYNLVRARTWLENGLGEKAASHLALVTANPTRATEWLGGKTAHLFDMPLSVGGRFSLWSSASLGCMIYLGADTFEDILRGANAMDEHAAKTAMTDNMPMRFALMDYWNATVRGESMRVVLAYANRLRLLPTYLQQLEMESNGKTITPVGEAIERATAPASWGGEGSVGQHSYHQWLHQGSHAVPCEFILAPDAKGDPVGTRTLIAHALAQAEVLANGRSFEQVIEEEPGIAEDVARQKVHEGGRPSTFISHPNFGPEAFGALIAMYEHRTYFAGQLWGLNPFDQWGVERGKTMANRLQSALKGESETADPVTRSLVFGIG